jgi:uncharacterized protein with FMN-binding domain
MASSVSTPKRDLAYYARKYVVAALVLASFIGYALHDRQAYADAADVVAAARPMAMATVMPAPTATPTALAPTRLAASPIAAPGSGTPARPSATVQASLTPRPVNTPVPRPTATPIPSAYVGPYKDGTYPGPIANTVFGPVQVQAVIQGGRIASVDMLDYPHVRRTSVAINSVAKPRLEQEAVQIQGAQVHLLSGATITARGFIESLRGALNNARP